MTERSGSGGKTPGWLWVVFAVGIAIFAAGSFLARIEHQLYGVLILAVGLAVVVTFTALRGRYTRRR
jgi:hypothetical protein